MAASSIYDHEALASQVVRQQKYAWDLEVDFPWARLPDHHKPFLPLDQDCIAFPNASAEQRLVLSQFFGVFVNATIAALEKDINQFRFVGWEKKIRQFPVGPEMKTLGHLFFEEETKHAHAFSRFNQAFCQSLGIDPLLLSSILPDSQGSIFTGRLLGNTRRGGQAFWWLVAIVEEVSLEVYKIMLPHQASLDPYYLHLHKRHMEEEARHHNYAFLMIDLNESQNTSLLSQVRSKTDLITAQFLLSGWILSELRRFKTVKKFEKEHEFFKTLASCIPLLNSVSFYSLFHKLFAEAPYISLLMNAKHHPLTQQSAERHKVFSLPFPSPKNAPVFADL